MPIGREGRDESPRAPADNPRVKFDYDLLVIGSGPGGQKAAIQAAKLGKRVAVVDRRETLGGVCTNTGTIPSKTLREAVVFLTGMSQRGIYGQSYRVKDDITSEDVFARIQHVVQREIDVVRSQLARNRVQVLSGHGRFARPAHGLRRQRGRASERRVTAAKIVIATGTRPARPPTVAFDGRTVLDSDDIVLSSTGCRTRWSSSAPA